MPPTFHRENPEHQRNGVNGLPSRTAATELSKGRFGAPISSAWGRNRQLTPQSSTAAVQPFAVTRQGSARIRHDHLRNPRDLLVSDRRSAALNWEGVVPSHVRKAR